MAEENKAALLTRLEGNARSCSRTGRPVTGRFIPRENVSDAVHFARLEGIEASAYGGYEDAERVQICFHPDSAPPCFTAVWMEIIWNPRFAHITHPSLLGSLMGLGIDRSYFGDLIAAQDKAHLFCLPEIACRLPSEWTSAGKDTIHVSPAGEAPELSLPEGETFQTTVASLRLDSLLCAGMNCSRSHAQAMIREGAVMVNHQGLVRVDHEMHEGDLISVRGHGRIRFREIRGTTRKDRISILLERFLHH